VSHKNSLASPRKMFFLTSLLSLYSLMFGPAESRTTKPFTKLGRGSNQTCGWSRSQSKLKRANSWAHLLDDQRTCKTCTEIKHNLIKSLASLYKTEVGHRSISSDCRAFTVTIESVSKINLGMPWFDAACRAATLAWASVHSTSWTAEMEPDPTIIAFPWWSLMMKP
jgi:hypothetical protein